MKEYLQQQVRVIFDNILKEQPLVRNQIASYDEFVGSQYGIRQILEQQFIIQNIVPIDSNGVRGERSYLIDIRFTNVRIRERNIENEDIQDLSLQQEQSNVSKVSFQDVQLPINARLQARTLKIDIVSDILLTLRSFSGTAADGEQLDIKKEIMQEALIVQIPLMIGSKYSFLASKNAEQRIRLGEDILDLGGYLILRGGEWSVDSTESVKYNELQLKNSTKTKEVNGFVMSKLGDLYENSFSGTVKFSYKNNQITSTIDPYERIHFIQIPFFMIFRLFDVSNQMEMVEMILEDEAESQEPLAVQLKQLIQLAVDNQYTHFPDGQSLTTAEQVADKIAEVLNSDQIKKKMLESTLVYSGERVKDTFQAYFLPHLGQTASDNYKKMRFYGLMIKQVLTAYITQQFPDRHSYLEKRIHSTGHNMGKMFKKSFNHQVVGQVKQQIIRELHKVRDIQKVNCSQIMQKQLNSCIQNKILQKPIVSGQNSELSKTGMIQMKRRIQSQGLNRKNIINSVSQMRVINNQTQSLDKMSKKIIEQRSVQPSFAGYVCIIQSADSGDKAGKVKALASLALITGSISTKETSDLLWELATQFIYEVHVFQSRDIKRYQLKKVFINGFWIGYIQTKNVLNVANILRQRRREEYYKWKHLTVYVNPEGQLQIYTDFGRILCPLLLVHYDAKGYPYLKLQDNKIYEHIMSGQGNIDWYLENQVLEYVSVEESHNCLVAESVEAFIDNTKPNLFDNPKTRCRYTHVMIPQSMLGLVALLSPFANHAQTKRITMFTNQAKQSCGWAMFNYPYRLDKGLIIQQYVSQPLVRTVMHDHFPPNGQQIMVAYTIYDGFNQDDSVIFNRGSIDQGLFNAVYYTYEETQVKYNEYIDRITNIQPEGAYGNHLKLIDGIIAKNVWIQKDDVLVAKKEQTRSGDPHTTSLVYKGLESAYVEDIMVFYDDQSIKTIRIKLKIIRNLKQGDKFSSGGGCKGIVSKTMAPHEMPYTSDGIIPDMIFNTTSIPTRFMIAQLLEATFQNVCIQMCDQLDATVFNDIPLEEAEKLMDKYKVQDEGYRYLYNGDTGERIKARIFVAGTFYQRLQKFSVTAKFVTNQSSLDLVTRQPNQNRQAGAGSLRLGAQELESMYGGGTASILNEKSFFHSDHFDQKLCAKCGQLAIYNDDNKFPLYRCLTCNDKAEIVNVESGWSSLLFKQTLSSMGINCKQIAQPPVFEVDA